MFYLLKSGSGSKSKVIHVPGIRSSFSFFGHIFMDNQTDLQEVEKKLILEHESAHIEQYHWVDILLAQIVCSLQWFNPFAWMYLHSVKQNQEFLADRSIIEKGYSPVVYYAVLINNTFQPSFKSRSRGKSFCFLYRKSDRRRQKKIQYHTNRTR
jgi:hypothetical protein